MAMLTLDPVPATLALEVAIGEPVMAVYRSNGSRVEFYEHPRFGDDAPAIAHENGCFFFTDDVWDLASARLYCGLDA